MFMQIKIVFQIFKRMSDNLSDFDAKTCRSAPKTLVPE